MGLPDGTLGRLPASRFTAADYVAAARTTGFAVESCHEPAWPDLGDGHGGPVIQRWCPDAARSAYVGTPAAIVWRFRREDEAAAGRVTRRGRGRSR